MFIVKTINVKPAGKKFRTPQMIPGTQMTLGMWTNNQSGVIHNRTRRIGKNKLINIMKFTDQAAYEAYAAAAASNPEFQARQQYNVDNNITTRVFKFQVIE